MTSASTDTSQSSLYTTASEGAVPEEQRSVITEQSGSFLRRFRSAISPQSNNILRAPTHDGSSTSSGSLRSIPTDHENELSFDTDRAERHYRHYLQHGFDDRLTLPLWFPSVVPLGSIGYVRHGQFHKLMDANVPPMGMTELPPMPFLDEFSSLQTNRCGFPPWCPWVVLVTSVMDNSTSSWTRMFPQWV